MATVDSESIMKDLKKKRGSIKRRLTHLKKYVNSFNGTTLSEQQRAEVKLRMVGSQNLMNDFNHVQTQIEDISPESEIDSILESRELFEREYFSVLALAECMSHSDESSTGKSKLPVEKCNIKLPTISVPDFDGTYEHWLEYRDTFASLVHNCETISPIQKFHYLKSSLKGSAKSVIDSLEFSESNYDIAWELLLNRFDNKKLLIRNHLKSIFSMPTLSKESSIQIRKLIDTILKNLRALKILGEPTEYWDTLIIYIVVSKLDSVTEREWEQHFTTLKAYNRDSKEKLKLDHLLQFLKNRADILETLIVSHGRSGSQNTTEHKKPYIHTPKIHCNIAANKSVSKSSKNARNTKYLCIKCNEQHPLYSCQKFLDLDLHNKLILIKDNKLCINCLRSGHTADTCVFGPCRKCDKKHNTLICDVNHKDSNNSRTVTLVATNEVSKPYIACTDRLGIQTSNCVFPINNIHAHSSVASASVEQPVLLSTALVEIGDDSGVYHKARAVLDSGSERSFITQSLCDKLNTHILQSTQLIRGVGSSITQCSQSCNIELKSLNGNFTRHIQCLVLPQITSKLPSFSLNRKDFNIPTNITLADPNFHDSQAIDMLIGADLFWELIRKGQMRLSNGPFLQNTHLGWVLSGSILPLKQNSVKHHVHCNLTQTSNDCMTFSLDKLLRQFWEIEELPSKSTILSDEERACEEHFVQHTKRMVDGRFNVRIPFKQAPESLGDTRTQAESRFFALERKLNRNPEYKKMYSDFIHEYIDLGHMSLTHTYGKPHYFLPHHGVFREHATTTKLRTVFDAGMKSTSGLSLNEIQMVGSAIQGDLVSILLRFRENKYVACADIEKMYRQVLVNEDQRDLQLILWRDDHTEPLRVYRLNTVTYGTASAPFLSCRCLKQLAQECDIPDVAREINESFYVDDLILSCDSKSRLNSICEGITQVLEKARLPLRKWLYNFHCANPNDSPQHAQSTKQLSPGDTNQSKVLGLGWNNHTDLLHYKTQINRETTPITKRIILSHVSQIYDPLGLLSPIITFAKTLLQKCWLLKLDYDEPVPSDVTALWYKFVDSMYLLKTVSIPRHIMCIDPVGIELHIFTDASQLAYGACAYVRTIDSESAVTVRLLCSKGKVAPVKPTTIPRLELCGALLGAKLYAKINSSLRSPFHRVIFWTDSKIVLGWLGMSPNLLKTFVQHRTAEIHELTKEHTWRHVSGKQNPADLVSRGQSLDVIIGSTLWWDGPQFLHEHNYDTPNISQINEINNNNSLQNNVELPELKSTNVLSHIVSQNNSNILFPFDRFSQYNRMKRTVAYILRFIHNARNKNNRLIGSLSIDELKHSEMTLARLSQQESYPEVYEALSNNKMIKKDKHLIKLNIFMDENRIIRVGGRIQNSDFEYNKKHPVLICAKHAFSVLLFRYEHERTLHAGSQLLLFTLREAWWPVGGRNLAKKVTHACVTCARLRASTVSPIMGNLPAERLDPGFAFLHCGVDYAGPVLILNRKGRGSKLQKAYICLFVCFVTRAVHLELVSDLSSEGYILALKRFIARRGKPKEIFSDNGKNFVGAMNEFAKILSSCSQDIIEYATSMNIKFKMIPCYASHFGGLWEAAVKSCKHHLRRVVGNAHLTFEEFSTVLTQIEAILNSRPLSPMSSDPQDLLPLSPAHFLVGRSLTAPVMADISEIPTHRLTRYQRVEQLRQHFWNRWAKEYISELQTRKKWHQHKDDLKENTLVLLKDDNLPPLKWMLGRITKTYPGQDGIARVADIRTSGGIVRRAFSKICPLHEE